jgi:hypothetical protein
VVERLPAVQFSVVQPIEEPGCECRRHNLPVAEPDKPLEEYRQAERRAGAHASPGDTIRWWCATVPRSEPTTSLDGGRWKHFLFGNATRPRHIGNAHLRVTRMSGTINSIRRIGT